MITIDIYQELNDCAELIKESCYRFGEKVEQMKQLSTNETFKRNTKMRKNVNSIVESLALMSNFCALWNVDDADVQMTIAEAVKSAMSLYRKRKNISGFGFSSIDGFILHRSESISKKESEEEKNRCKKEFEEFFAGIKSNKLALVPYILIENATKYAKQGSSITVKNNYVDENTGEIIFENMGPVIEDAERIFDADFRGENASKMRSNLGSGKGLAFAKSILEENGCSIEVEQVGEEERYDDIPYKLTRFTVTLNKNGVCGKTQAEDSDLYYQSIDSMFNHEYFNIKGLIGRDFRSIRESLYMHTANVGLTEEIAQPLREAFAELEALKAQLFFVLSKYAYRNDAAVPDNRLDGAIQWTNLYRDVERQFEPKIANAKVAIDTKVEIQNKLLGSRRLNLQAFKDEQDICNLEIVKDIPLLVYELILKLAGNSLREGAEEVARITLSPGRLNGYYMWHNTIEIEANSDEYIRDIEAVKEDLSNTPIPFSQMSYAGLLVRMLRKYVTKIGSPFEIRTTPLSNRVILKFSVSNDEW